MYDGFLERRILAGADHGVLHGVRLAVKGNTPVEGFRFTAGHTLFLNRRAPYTAPAVQLLLDSGAVIVGTTCSDAGGFGVTTPGVINPIARDLIVGGSTGGAAALASGDADLGIGTDTTGSIRIPAACTGVHDKAVKLRELELPVLRAMIYETFLLNMCDAPVVPLPDLSSTGGLAESVPFSFQIAGPHRSTYPA